jgi:hypothetical protein
MDTKDKQQERLKQIEEAAVVYAFKMCKGRVQDLYNISAHDLIELSFIAGAKVADKCPRKGLVKIEDVRAIHRMWLEDDNDNSDFLEYFTNYCDKEGWL